MANLEDLTPGQVLADMNVAEYFKALGLSIAEAQQKLDENAVKQFNLYAKRDPNLGDRSLFELGLRPAFHHYQYADITVAMQLSMKVGSSTSFGFGLNIGVGVDTGGGTATGKPREAELTLSRRPAALTVDAARVGVEEGGSLDDAADALAQRLRKPTGVFDRVFVQRTGTLPTPTLTPADAGNPIVAPGLVAFIPTAARASALLRIARVPTDADEEFTLKSGATGALKATVPKSPPGTTLVDHAAKVVVELKKLAGVDARLVGGDGASAPLAPGALAIVLFDTDQWRLRPEDIRALDALVQTLNEQRSRKLKVVGYTDTRGTEDHNRKLAVNRAAEVVKYLKNRGLQDVTAGEPETMGPGRWVGAGAPLGENVAQFRRVEVVDAVQPAQPPMYIVVDAPSSMDDKPSPDLTVQGAAPDANGFVAASKLGERPVPAGAKVVPATGAAEITLSGAATGNAVENSPEAYAANLARSINDATATNKLRAQVRGTHVLIAPADAALKLTLLYAGLGDPKLGAEGGLSVSKPLAPLDGKAPGAGSDAAPTKVSVAAGLSIDYRTSRMFETSITGNSEVKARLAAVPPPAEFEDLVRTFIAEQRKRDEAAAKAKEKPQAAGDGQAPAPAAAPGAPA